MADHQRRRKDDRLHWRILSFFQRFFTIIGVATVISIVLVSATVSRFANFLPAAMPDKILLTYTFKQGLRDTPGKPSFSQPLLRPPTVLSEVVGALKNAEKDARVKGFVARLQDVDYSTAQVQELRGAVQSFRKAGKFAWIFGEGFGGFSPGMSDYYLAAAFDEIWLQPVGMVSITGVAAEVPFLRDLLDKAGVLPQFGHKGAYKSSRTARCPRLTARRWNRSSPISTTRWPKASPPTAR
jgi:protease-4